MTQLPGIKMPVTKPKYYLGTLVITPWGLGVVQGVSFRIRPSQHLIGDGKVKAIRCQIDWSYFILHLDENHNWTENGDWWESELSLPPDIAA